MFIFEQFPDELKGVYTFNNSIADICAHVIPQATDTPTGVTCSPTYSKKTIYRSERQVGGISLPDWSNTTIVAGSADYIIINNTNQQHTFYNDPENNFPIRVLTTSEYSTDKFSIFWH